MQKLLMFLITLLSVPVAYGMEPVISNEMTDRPVLSLGNDGSENLPETVHLVSETVLGNVLFEYNPHKASNKSDLYVEVELNEFTLMIPKPSIIQTPLGTIAHLNRSDISCIEYQRTKDIIIETAALIEESQTYIGGSCNLEKNEFEIFQDTAQIRDKFNQFKAAFEAAQRK